MALKAGRVGVAPSQVDLFGIIHGSGVIESLNNIEDVNITNPTNRQSLVYDSATQKWVNGAGTDDTLVEAVNKNWQGKGYNLIPFPYYDGMSKTVSGVIFTVNSDGSISTSGVAEANINYTIVNAYHLSSGKSYRLSGCPSGGASNTYQVDILEQGGSFIVREYGNGEIFTPNQDYPNSQIRIRFQNGQSASDLTFRPMLVEVDSNGRYPTEYQRYAMGNVELQNTIKGVSGGDEWLASKAYSINNYVIYQNKLYRCKANTTAGILPTDTTYWEVITIASIVARLTALES